MFTTMAKAGSVCSVYYCQNCSWQKNSVSFFRFPRDRDTCAQWVNKCRRADLDELFQEFGPIKLNSSNRICAKHFKTSDFRNPKLTSQGLKRNVVPSLFLSPPDDVGTRTRYCVKKRIRQDSPERRVDIEEQMQGSIQEMRQAKRNPQVMSLQIKLLTAKLRKAEELISEQRQVIKSLRQEKRALLKAISSTERFSVVKHVFMSQLHLQKKRKQR